MNRNPSKASAVVLAAALLMVSGVALAQTWDGATATNNDDGGDDQSAYSDTTTTSDSDSDSDTDSVNSDGWNGEQATNNDDGTGTNSTWDGDQATNDDDGASTNNEWDGEEAENDDDMNSSTEWNGTESENDDDGPGDGTTWDGDQATNDDNGDNTEPDNPEDNTENNQNDEETSQDENSDSSSGGGGDGVSSVSWTTVKVLEPDIRFQLSPSPAKVEESVKVTGHLNHSNSPTVTVRMDGETVAQTESAEDGDFSTRFTPEETGTHTVQVSSKGTSAETQIEVNPSVQVSGITSNVFQDGASSTAVICADIESQTTPTVKLNREGTTVMSKSQTGNVCFETDVERGIHEFSIIGEVDGDTDQESTTVTVSEPQTTSLDTGGTTTDLSNEQRGLLAGILQPLANLITGIANFIAQAIPA